MPTTTRTFTPSEVAQILNVTVQAVYRWQGQGIMSSPVTDAELFAALNHPRGVRVWAREARAARAARQKV